MNASESEVVEKCLEKPDVHQQWEKAYRTPENERFKEQAFDYITHVINASNNSTTLDAGCGVCAHSILLANRGFFVRAVDFSQSVLIMAEANVKARGLENKIKVQRGNILALSFEDMTFDYILCWGVLMHIPDIEKAISELARVLKPGGILVIGEGIMYSLRSIILRTLKRFLGKKAPDGMEYKSISLGKKTLAGIEYWSVTSAGMLLARQANIRWLIERFKSNRFIVKKHLAGQFTEVCVIISSHLLKNLVHGFNNFWFRYIKIPHFAFDDILIFKN